jgi:hypothetical protein
MARKVVACRGDDEERRLGFVAQKLAIGAMGGSFYGPVAHIGAGDLPLTKDREENKMESTFVTRFGISSILVVLGDKSFLLLSVLLNVGLAGLQSFRSTTRARRWSLLGSMGRAWSASRQR